MKPIAIAHQTQTLIIQDSYQDRGRYSILIPGIARNISKITLPTLALLAVSNISGAEAGPLAYSACVLACTGTGPAAPFCWTCCLAALFVPGP